MANPTKLTPHSTPRTTEPTSIERVEAWTVSQLADTLATTSLSPTQPSSRGTSVKLSIPLDISALDADSDPAPSNPVPSHTVHKRRAPIRRDSLKRREALLKGKEGSRQRRRWENDRLLGNPHAQPPLPEDWEVRPATYPRQSVPYFLAPLWEAEFAARKEEKEREREREEGRKEDAAAREVRREVREKLKRSKGAKGLLMDLEGEVRAFVVAWEERVRVMEREGLVGEEDDSEDEEIVFVGRNGVMSDEVRRERELGALERDRVVFESLVQDRGAAFGRFLVHAIAQYYDLATWSVTTGDAPPKRQAYVGVKTDPVTRRPSFTRCELPRPLWTVV